MLFRVGNFIRNEYFAPRVPSAVAQSIFFPLIERTVFIRFEKSDIILFSANDEHSPINAVVLPAPPLNEQQVISFISDRPRAQTVLTRLVT